MGGADLEPGKAVERAFEDQVRERDGGLERIADDIVEPAVADLHASVGREYGSELRDEFDAIASGYIRNALLNLAGGSLPSSRMRAPSPKKSSTGLAFIQAITRVESVVSNAATARK